MYRIHFKHNGGFFCIQILVFGFIWLSVRTEGKIVQHRNFTAASAAVLVLGLDKLYENKSQDAFRRHLEQQQLQFSTQR